MDSKADCLYFYVHIPSSSSIHHPHPNLFPTSTSEREINYHPPVVDHSLCSVNEQHWANFWQTGWRADMGFWECTDTPLKTGLFKVHRYPFENRAFQSAQTPLWKQGFSKCTDTPLKTGLFKVHRHPFENRTFHSAQIPLWKQTSDTQGGVYMGFESVHLPPLSWRQWPAELHLPVWLLLQVLTTHICKHVCMQSGQKTKAQQQQKKGSAAYLTKML